MLACMKINPFIIGHGRAAQAIASSLHVLNLLEPDLDIAEHRHVPRDTPLRSVSQNTENPVLFIANPAGLHADKICEATQGNFLSIFSEKPVCVDLEQVKRLKEIQQPVAVLHVYRQLWGPQSLRNMIESGEFGKIIAVESRYWQPSVAHRALESKSRSLDWKADPKLSGDFDVYLDLGTHWVDLVSFLIGTEPQRAKAWLSYVNAESPHRDTHVHLTLDFENDVRALGSISKVVHGSTNGLEVHILGEKQSASWNFMAPDEIIIGRGRDRAVLTRKDSFLGSKLMPFHGMGWLEGYIEIMRQAFFEIQGKPSTPYPTMKESLKIAEILLTAEIERAR